MSLHFTREHEWIRVEGDVATVGISDHAQQALGDIVFAEVPQAGKRVAKGAEATSFIAKAVVDCLRRHRVIELYLTEKLDYDWASVHDEAERLEHVASDELVERMARTLGEPDVDPHGAPIPSRQGALRAVLGKPLDQIEPGQRVTIREVDDRDSARLRYLKKLGLVPAAVLYVAHRAPFGGPLTVRVGGERGTRRVIGQELASCVVVASR